MGYDARWGVLGACDAGAPHKRERIWILADSVPSGEWRDERQGEDESDALADGNGLRELQSERIEQDQRGRFSNSGGKMANPTSQRQSGSGASWYASDPAEARERETDRAWAERIGNIWGIESSVGRVAHGMANRTNRLKAIGNGQVPSVAALAWKVLSE